MTENSEPIIAIKGLKKSYGRFEAIHGIDLSIKRGEIFGFLGPNGAGKTTTIRVVLDFIRPTAGEVRVLGMDSMKDTVEIRRRIGYLPGEVGLFGDQTGRQFLGYMKELQGGSDERIEELIERFKFDPDRKVKDYSKGNRQKLSIIQAFMHDPELLILDEPTSGLDPLMQQEFYRLLDEERERGKTVFLSSHLLAEVEHVCDRVAIIREGNIITVESVSELKEKMGKVMEVTFDALVDPGELRIDGVKEITCDGAMCRMVITGNVDQIIKRIADHKVVNMSFQSFSLEHLFLTYYNGMAKAEATDAEHAGGGVE